MLLVIMLHVCRYKLMEIFGKCSQKLLSGLIRQLLENVQISSESVWKSSENHQKLSLVTVPFIQETEQYMGACRYGNSL